MNRENFPDFLNNTEKLSQLTYEELKTLSLQYPYCANLHLLLWQKSRQEGHPDEEKNLAKAAAYTFDRGHLFQLYHHGEPLTVERFMGDHHEVLELKDLSVLEPVPVPREIQRPFGESDLAETPAANMTVGEDLSEDEDDPEAPDQTNGFSEIPNEAQIPEMTASPESVKDLEIDLPPLRTDLVEEAVDTLAAGLGSLMIAVSGPESGIDEITREDEPEPAMGEDAENVVSGPREIVFDLSPVAGSTEPPAPEAESIPDIEEEVPPPAPMPKHKFASWRSQSSARPAFVIPDAPDEENAHKEVKVRDLAEQSLTDNDGIISETLARLLADQGQNEKAIKMFERLMHKNPKKSAYFAAKIEELKKN